MFGAGFMGKESGFLKLYEELFPIQQQKHQCPGDRSSSYACGWMRMQLCGLSWSCWCSFVSDRVLRHWSPGTAGLAPVCVKPTVPVCLKALLERVCLLHQQLTAKEVQPSTQHNPVIKSPPQQACPCCMRVRKQTACQTDVS